jgi:carbamoyltransferase
MLVIGLNGGLDLIGEHVFDLPSSLGHDAAAVLIEDGNIIAGIEEERLTRIKHTNSFPIRAIEHCLKTRNVSINEIDLVAVYLKEQWLDDILNASFIGSRKGIEEMSAVARLTSVRSIIAHRIFSEFGVDVSGKLRFIDHHMAHAQSAYAFSGFNESLIGIFDSAGETTAGFIGRAAQGRVTKLREIHMAQSLGVFYLSIIKYIGFDLFDEYKVMGLAPYGNPARFRERFGALYSLMDEGEYKLATAVVRLQELQKCGPPRKRDQPVEQSHKDIAAALQEALEKIVLHTLRYFQEATGLKQLCLAGGVAHNCTMNGKILASGVFDSTFVQPAAHDAGSALGAATQAYLDAGGEFKPRTLGALYWGSNADEEDIATLLQEKWNRFLCVEYVDDVTKRAAQLLADGHVIGWVQGKSEFGPRSLGNRSIIADPRPRQNKERINAMVKKREAFRPFAPSVLIEAARDFFDFPDCLGALPYMIFVVTVKPDKRNLLGAVTHVDGTARVQTVAISDNPLYWNLIKQFELLTGVPVVLNTSFNNNVEPIVESVEDAIVCLLTTGLDSLVVNNWVVKKKDISDQLIMSMRATLPPYIEMIHTVRSDKARNRFQLLHLSTKRAIGLSRGAFELLCRADGEKTVEHCLKGSTVMSHSSVLSEIRALWVNRFVVLQP